MMEQKKVNVQATLAINVRVTVQAVPLPARAIEVALERVPAEQLGSVLGLVLGRQLTAWQAANEPVE